MPSAKTSHRVSEDVALALASAFLTTEWTPQALVAVSARVLGAGFAITPVLALRLIRAFAEAPHSDFAELARFVVRYARIHRPPWLTGPWQMPDRLPVLLARPVAMAPPGDGPRAAWDLPTIDAPGDLEAYLGLTTSELEWFADARGLERLSPPKIRHYTYTWIPKAAGGFRLLEAPKPRLMALQRRLLRELLDRVPPHDAAHGFRAGRGTRTHAEAHAGRAFVLRIDLEDFFLSITAAHVRAIFHALGYASETGSVLAAITTNRAPVLDYPKLTSPSAHELDARFRTRKRYDNPHLPQGAPTSPALANLAAYRLDARLAAAAEKAGAVYTRYADDLVFSGNRAFGRGAARFVAFVTRIAADEGFVVNSKKTRAMHESTRQSVTGLIVNDRPAPPRADYERLEAILFNCVRRGPVGENRAHHPDFRAHLQGRIAHVGTARPARRKRLEALYAAIDWGS